MRWTCIFLSVRSWNLSVFHSSQSVNNEAGIQTLVGLTLKSMIFISSSQRKEVLMGTGSLLPSEDSDVPSGCLWISELIDDIDLVSHEAETIPRTTCGFHDMFRILSPAFPQLLYKLNQVLSIIIKITCVHFWNPHWSCDSRSQNRQI